ncbi:hypothetical protein CEXT_272001 [Caerostris extrusa]|uniref:C2H2-type domain-containing protein n=1 Tax=Caerostris extrusa TaxID=172846 RepID=A0AAV4UPG5_CAEEX|nr:hypothetical protein CEXT_272001 [Caerostris extrusa]
MKYHLMNESLNLEHPPIRGDTTCSNSVDFCGVEEVEKDFKDTFFVNDGFDSGGCDYDEVRIYSGLFFVPEFGCDLCDHVSRTNKGLRAHRIWTHKVG